MAKKQQRSETAPTVSLESVPVAPTAPAAIGPPSSYVPVAAQRELVRTVLALGLLATLMALALGYSAALLAGVVSGNDVTKLLAGVFTPILGVFGAVTGFYYGSHASDGSTR